MECEPQLDSFASNGVKWVMWYVYVLRSLKDKKLYTGLTSDLRRRIKQHKVGDVISTRERRPLELIYYEAGLSECKARKREIYLKTAWGKRYLQGRV